LSPEAKLRVKEAGLDRNERALLTIAKANNRKAQLKKVSELTQSIEKHKVVGRSSAAATNQSSDPKLHEPIKPEGSNRRELTSKTIDVAGSQQETSPQTTAPGQVQSEGRCVQVHQ
jgi:hypothetical protein